MVESNLSLINLIFSFRCESLFFPEVREFIQQRACCMRQENADIIRRVLGGEAGPRRDIVLMNAAAALVAGGKARDFKEGVALAAQSIDSGAAAGKLAALVAFSQRMSAEAPV